MRWPVFATLAALFLVVYLGMLFPSGQLLDGVGFASASVSDTSQSVATYGVQGMIPWIANDSNELLSKWEGQTKGSDGAAWWAYGYDANGNLTTGTQTNGKETFAKYAYTWDVKNRLSRFEENDKDRQRNGYEFESGLRYLKEDMRFTKQEPMFEMVLQRSLYSDMGEQLLAEQETYSDHKVTRGYVYFGNQRVGVVERREALAAAQSATQEGSRGSSPGGIERATALSNHEGSRGSSPGFPNGKDRWTSYVRDHQGTLLMSLAEYEAQAASWGMTDPRYLDAAGKSRLETTAKIGANQYYVYPYGVLPHKGFLYAQLQGAEYTGKNLDEGTQWYYFHARHYDSGHGRFIGHDMVSPDLNNPLTLNPFLYCLNNPGRWVDPDGKNFEFWSFQSAFDFAFQTDFGESGKTFVDKAPDRLGKMPGFVATKGFEAGGDMIQAKSASFYSGMALATIEMPPISFVFNTLGSTKAYLDYKEASLENKERAMGDLKMNLLGSTTGIFSPLKLVGLAKIPLTPSLMSGLEAVRGMPFFVNDLLTDLRQEK